MRSPLSSPCLSVIVSLAGLALASGCASAAGAGPASAPTMTPAPVARIAFHSFGGMVIMPVQINGSRDLNMILDTGMSAPLVMLFHRELGSELRLEGGQPVRVPGAGGQPAPEGRLYTGATVAFGGVRQPEQTVIVMGETRESSTWMQDGIIGKSIFDRYVVDIDYEHSMLSLYEPESFQAQGFTGIPVSLASGMPTAEAKVENEKGEIVPVRLVVDIGAGHALSLQADPAIHLPLPARTIRSVLGRGIQGEIEGRIGRIRSLRLGPYTFPNVISSFPPEESGTTCVKGGTGANGNLGTGVLRRFRLVIDYYRQRILLSPGSGFDRPFEQNMAGLGLEPRSDGSLYVRSVIKDSPAAEADIARGDRIIAIDGRKPDVAGQADPSDTFEQDGLTLHLTVDRNGTRSERPVKLRRLI